MTFLSFYFDFFSPKTVTVSYYYCFLDMQVHKGLYLKQVVPYLYIYGSGMSEFYSESYSYMVYGMPEFLEYVLEYTTILLVMDLYYMPGPTSFGWWWASYSIMDALFFSPQMYSDIKMIAFFLYDYMFLHLSTLGFLFFSMIVGIVSLLLSRNMRVRRQHMFDQQSNALHNHVVQCT